MAHPRQSEIDALRNEGRDDLADKIQFSPIQMRLTIDINYIPNEESEQDLINRLEEIPGKLAGEGLLTGDSTAEVESWSSKVQRVKEVSIETLSWKKSN